MLVKFISFVITLFGTKRYQPIVFAGIAVIISAVGVGAVASVYKVPPTTVASTVDQADDPTTEAISSQTPAKKDLHQQTTLNQDKPETSTPQQTTPATSGAVASAANAAPTIQLTSGDSTVTLKQGDTASVFTVALSDSTNAQWNVTNDQSSGLTITPTTSDKTATPFSFTVKAHAPGTYNLTVHAKDPARGGELATKNISVTVTPN